MEEIRFSNGSRAIPTNLEDCYIIEPAVFGDNRDILAHISWLNI